jgi:uncharacterized protein (DUF3084 family)
VAFLLKMKIKCFIGLCRIFGDVGAVEAIFRISPPLPCISDRAQAEEDRLARELRERDEQQLAVEEKYASVQECDPPPPHRADAGSEIAEKSKKLKKLWAKYQEAKQEIKDLQQEFQNEREYLLESIREQDRQVGGGGGMEVCC